MPTTKAQKDRIRQIGVAGQLRKASEGLDPGFTKPKMKHSFSGVPSAHITAAVAKDRIIMWHVGPRVWNGKAAAAMYSGQLRPALQRCWGKRPWYRVVEDGDPTGFQSNAGKRAKKASGIKSEKLPPRTPEWMPLDYSIWAEIVKRVMRDGPAKETRTEFLERLRRVALSLPKAYVRTVLESMKKRIIAVREAQGHNIKCD